MHVRSKCALVLGIALTALTLTSCSDRPTTGLERPGAELAFVLIPPDYVSTIGIQVTGPGIDSALVFNFSISNGVATGTLRLPAGAGRHLVARAFDDTGVETHRGDTTVTLVEGTNPSVSFLLKPLVGGQPLTVTIGSNVVAVNRRDTTIAQGDTVRFTATAVNWRGVAVPADSVTWASSNPAVATVSASGLVTALAAGTANVVASYEGAASHRMLTVRQAGTFASLVFDGVRQYAETPNASDLSFAGNYTLEAWVKLSRYQASHLISKWGLFPNASYVLAIGTDGMLDAGLWKTSYGFDEVKATVALALGTWQHVAVVHASDSLRLYVDGSLVALTTGVGSLASSTCVLAMGRTSEEPASHDWSYFPGAMSDVRVWNVARTSAQIAGSRSVRLTGSEAGLVVYWRLDEGVGDVAQDATGHGHTARLGGAAGADSADPTWSTDGPSFSVSATRSRLR